MWPAVTQLWLQENPSDVAWHDVSCSGKKNPVTAAKIPLLVQGGQVMMLRPWRPGLVAKTLTCIK